MNAPLPEVRTESLRSFGILVGAVLAVLVAYAIIVMLVQGDWTKRGQFGDMFGAANTLFSGLAFTALVYALLLQRKELGLQRAELALTRGELAKQSDAQTQQSKTALRAAQISALGALLQTYAQLLQSGHTSLIDPRSYPDEMLRVREELKRLLEAKDA